MNAKHPVHNDRLRQARLRKGWKQEQLAEKLGVALETVSRWERGEAFPSPLLREELSRILGVSLEALGLVQHAEASATPPSAAVLISASAEADRALLMQYHADLQTRGLAVWSLQSIKQLDATQKRAILREAIRSTELVVVVVSPATRSSRDVRTALDQATLYRRPVCAVWTAGELWQTCFPDDRNKPLVTIDARTAQQEATLQELIGVYQQVQQAARERTDAPAVVSSSPQAQSEPRNPYKGLKAFRSDEQRDFFGRDQVIADLSRQLEIIVHAENQHEHVPFLTVLGPSGSGKSSVIAAGLLPHLRRGAISGSEDWVYLDPMVPGSHPLESLAQVLATHLPERSIATLRADLEDDTTRGLHRLVSALAQRPETKVVLVVDQCEELFTLTTNEAERQLFIDLLVTAATEPQSSIIIILTLRADFSERALLFPELGSLMQKHSYFLLPMNVHDLRAVIEEPAQLPGVQLTFEGNLIGDLLFEAQGQPGALPLLEFALDQLFQQRDGHLLMISAYQKIGGVKGALAKQAESTYIALPSEEHRRLARALFLRLIDAGMSEQDTARRRASLTELLLPDRKQTGIMQEVVEAFIVARLLTTNQVAGVPTVEVSHEAVIWEWTRLTDWLVTNRKDIRLQQSISKDATEWGQRNKPGDRLYRGSQLKEAKAWARRSTPSGDEVAFLRASAASRMRSLVMVIAVVLLLVSAMGIAGWFSLNRTPDFRSVTSLKDDGVGSLREAIKNASPESTISFAKNLKGTISLTSGEIVISKNLIIAGPGASLLSISGNEVSRVFSIHEGVTVAIFGVTITKGRTTDAGGGILNKGALTLTDSTVSGCVSTEGGGINNQGVLTITNSTISGNKANDAAGGITNGATLNILRSTISHNTARFAGGGIEDGYTLSLENSTVAYNRTTNGWGGGITVGGGGQASILATTIYGNTAATEGGNIFATNPTIKLQANIIAGGNARQGKDIWGKVISFGYGYNLIGTLDGATLEDDGTLPINFIGSPNVGPLQDNGGPTQTIALLPGSPAIDFIPLKFCQSTTDQRSMPRPDGNVPACDIGAYESSGLATATAQAKANATAETVANASPIAYPPHNQSPVLTDPLQDNSKGNNWEVDTSSGDCKFINQAYDINTHGLKQCFARTTDFTNFIYEVQMKIVTGDGGGIAFRIDPKTEQQYYYFAINQDGSYSISASGGVAGGGQANEIVFASGSSSAIHRGLNQTNLVAAVVHGQIIELYVNLQRVAVVSMVTGSRPPTHGEIGVIVTPSGHQTEVIFQNAKVWTV